MDFHLQNLTTGVTVKLPPDRTLIGSADYATIQTASDGPYLAALVVRYPTGWVLFGLCDEGVTFNRQPLHAAQRVTPKRGDLLIVGEDRYTFLTPGIASAVPDDAPPDCFAYITNPDGMEECRAVDHDLLFGRLPFCHVQLADARLSRLSALLASHAGHWYIHTLSKKPLGRNRKAVTHFTCVEDGDELLIGPLVVRIEIRTTTAERAELVPVVNSGSPSREPALATDDRPDITDTPGPYPDPTLIAFHSRGQQLENWLRKQNPTSPRAKTSVGGWFGAQRDKLKRFWLDTPETTTARGLRTAGRTEEAFVILDHAIRARPDGPELLRELYRLYESVGLFELCYRPLRHIEKLAQARGTPDEWVLESLAKLCERLGRSHAEMYDRAVGYWNKLEAATGVDRSRQRADVLARRTLNENGYANAADDS